MRTAKTKRPRRSTSKTPPRKPRRIPKLCHHKATDNGYVVLLNDKATCLGKFGRPETVEKYHQVIAEWTTNGRQMVREPNDITIKEVIARFWLHAETYYVKPDGRPTTELGNFQDALKFLKELYAELGDVALGTFITVKCALDAPCELLLGVVVAGHGVVVPADGRRTGAVAPWCQNFNVDPLVVAPAGHDSEVACFARQVDSRDTHGVCFK